jgi:hypothetical protein
MKYPRILLTSLLSLTLCIAFFPEIAFSIDDNTPATHSGDVSDREENIWIFFRDKGHEVEKNPVTFLNRCEANVSPKKRERWTRQGKRGKLVDYHDIALYRPYIETVSHIEGVVLRARSRWLNAISVRVKSGSISDILELPFVKDVSSVRTASRKTWYPCGREGKPPEHAHGTEQDSRGDSVRLSTHGTEGYGPSYYQLDQIAVTSLHDAGYMGEGIRIAVLDTGFRTAHRCFGQLRVAGERDFINDDDDTAFDPVQDGEWNELYYHGTYVLSILAAYDIDRMVGTAPRAEYLLAKTEDVTDEQPIEEDYWVEGIEWADSLGANVVSSSVAYSDWYDYADMDGETAVTTIAADLAVERGIVVCNAVGNIDFQGGDIRDWVIAPADGDHVLAIGSVDKKGDRSYFSCTGPTADDRIKPDLCAMGEDVYHVSYRWDENRPDDENYDSTGSGTSFSTPLAAGACALLIQVHPEWNPLTLARQLRENASLGAFGLSNNEIGWGVIDAFSAAGLDTSPPTDIPKSDYLYSFPNPFTDRTFFVYQLSTTCDVTLSIFNIAGELINELAQGTQSPGRYGETISTTVTWKGVNRRGEKVAPGIYTVLFQAGDYRETSSIALIR